MVKGRIQYCNLKSSSRNIVEQMQLEPSACRNMDAKHWCFHPGPTLDPLGHPAVILPTCMHSAVTLEATTWVTYGSSSRHGWPQLRTVAWRLSSGAILTQSHSLASLVCPFPPSFPFNLGQCLQTWWGWWFPKARLLFCFHIWPTWMSCV